ncbi:MAG: hypothetical protein IPJ41_03480 [Phycisphaerales bacterium]|nr:hypothetical protein [Phycisphaerales bacterium]
MGYGHTQRAPLAILLVVFAGATLVGAWSEWGRSIAGPILLSASAAFLLLAASFAHLRISDRGEFLSARFGPLPVFGTRVRYASITSIERGRSSWIDGWGIHFIPGRGWTFNLWGWDCVVLRCGERIVRLGTDDPEGLEQFLRTRVKG